MFRFLANLARLWRTKRWMKWIVFSIPILAILIMLGPALGVLNQILKLIVGMITPLLKTSGGRFVLVNVVLILVGIVVYWKFKARVRQLFAFWAMRHFLRGMQLLSGGFTERAKTAFLKVVRIDRFVTLETALGAYPEIAADAKVRLAMCHLREDDGDGALKWLAMAKKHDPPSGVMKTLREVRALAYATHPTLASETADKELEEAHKKDPSNVRVNRALLERADERGDQKRALELERRIYAASQGEDRAAAGRALIQRIHGHAKRLAESGDLPRARSLLKEAQGIDRHAEPIQLLLGEIEMMRHNQVKALEAWAQVPGPAARERVAGLLDGGDPRAIIQRYPQPELLLDVAERLIDRGAHDQARRTLDKADGLGADPVEVEKLRGDLARATDDTDAAKAHYLKAMTRVFGGHPGEPGEGGRDAD